MPTITAVGVARPRAQGHEMTITDIAKIVEKRNGEFPNINELQYRRNANLPGGRVTRSLLAI